MKCELIGKSCGSFPDRKTGEIVEFGKLYVIADFPKNSNATNVGKRCVEVKCSRADCEQLEIGDKLLIDMNGFNRAIDIEVL